MYGLGGKGVRGLRGLRCNKRSSHLICIENDARVDTRMCVYECVCVCVCIPMYLYFCTLAERAHMQQRQHESSRTPRSVVDKTTQATFFLVVATRHESLK